MGINFVNPYEEGMADVNRNGHPSSFNQFAALDLTTAQTINEYINLLNKIEEMVGELSGVSRQREGAINNSELVNNVERAVTQSSLITEHLFWQHSKCKERALQILLDTAKDLYVGKPNKLQFMLDDFSRNIVTVPDDFHSQDYDIFVSDASKDNKVLESLRALAQPALQAGATLYDVAVMYMTEDIADMKHKLQEIDEKKLVMAQIGREMEMQKEEKKLQAQVDMREAIVDEKRENSIRVANTAIEVALITAEKGAAGETVQPFSEDVVENRKLDLQQNKQQSDDSFRQRQLDNEMKMHLDNAKLKQKDMDTKLKIAKSKPATPKKK
jgi:hypothetical protein